jgi:hypothetical protein
MRLNRTAETSRGSWRNRRLNHFSHSNLSAETVHIPQLKLPFAWRSAWRKARSSRAAVQRGWQFSGGEHLLALHLRIPAMPIADSNLMAIRIPLMPVTIGAERR